MEKERKNGGCGKRVSGEYDGAGYWEMDCGDLGRLCKSCKEKK